VIFIISNCVSKKGRATRGRDTIVSPEKPQGEEEALTTLSLPQEEHGCSLSSLHCLAPSPSLFFGLFFFFSCVGGWWPPSLVSCVIAWLIEALHVHQLLVHLILVRGLPPPSHWRANPSSYLSLIQICTWLCAVFLTAAIEITLLHPSKP